MKDIYKISFVFLLFLSLLGCDKDDFARLNSNPSDLDQPDIRFSTAEVIRVMYKNDYLVWFYTNFDYVFPWSQVTTVDDSGNSFDFQIMGPNGRAQSIYETSDENAGMLANSRDIRNRIDQMSQEDREARQAIKGITYAAVIATALTETDYSGSMPYSEGALAPFTNPPLLTPVFDTQEKLFDTWLSELDMAISYLTASDQFDIGDDADVIYGGDYQKWAKFCNLLKLRIAARLVNADRAKAIQIVEEVATSSVGYMNDLADDFVYKRGPEYNGTVNRTQPGEGAKNFIDFMKDNKDPRLRFIFNKNQFNAEIVQAFIDEGVDLPSYIEENVVYDADGNFESWKAPGEPWVRYYGMPVSPDKTDDSNYDEYFKQENVNRISGTVFFSTSSYNQINTRTGYTFTYPTKPGTSAVQVLGSELPSYEVVLGSSAETNLYFAEFKLLGASLPSSAQDYFNKGVEFSVKRMDATAKNLNNHYYEGDPILEGAMVEQGAIKLRSNEIADLLTQPAYDLTMDGLEKVYIQQYINFAMTPHDMFTTVRRSGIPKKGSSYLAWESFNGSTGSSVDIPRRFEIATPTLDNLNYDNMQKAYSDQGFTTGTNDPAILSTERVWFDMNNPAYGAGPKQ